MMNVQPIKTDHDYRRTLARIDELMDAEPDTPKGDELDILATLIENYEDRHFPMGTPDPIDAILFRLDQQGLERKDLEPYLGSRHRVSEILNRKRTLSIAMIRRLHDGLRIPLESLIG